MKRSAKRAYVAYLSVVVLAPLLFLVYLTFDLVCLPRAAVFEAVNGGISALLLTLVVRAKQPVMYLLPAVVPAYVILIAPIVMIRELGWEKFITDRTLAYATFDAIAICQIILISAMMGMACSTRTAATAIQEQ